MKNQMQSLQQFYHATYLQALPYFKAKKTRQLTMLGLTLVALSIFGIFAINPTLSTIANLKKQLADNTYVSEKLSEKISNLSSLQQKYSALSGEIPIVEKAVPKNPQPPILMAKIRSIAEENHIELSTLQTLQIDLNNKKTAQFGTFAFGIQAKGSSDEIKSFLQALTQFDRIITFDLITINNGTTDDPRIKLSVRGKAFFKP